MAKSPDYKGKLTIYNGKFEQVGEIVMYQDPSHEPTHPEFYGQIHLTQNVTDANFGMWKHEETGNKCPRCNAPKKPQYKLCYKCSQQPPQQKEATKQ